MAIVGKDLASKFPLGDYVSNVYQLVSKVINTTCQPQQLTYLLMDLTILGKCYP